MRLSTEGSRSCVSCFSPSSTAIIYFLYPPSTTTLLRCAFGFQSYLLWLSQIRNGPILVTPSSSWRSRCTRCETLLQKYALYCLSPFSSFSRRNIGAEWNRVMYNWTHQILLCVSMKYVSTQGGWESLQRIRSLGKTFNAALCFVSLTENGFIFLLLH